MFPRRKFHEVIGEFNDDLQYLPQVSSTKGSLLFLYSVKSDLFIFIFYTSPFHNVLVWKL